MYNHSTVCLIQQTIGSPLALYCLAYARNVQTFPVSSVLAHFKEEYGMDNGQVRLCYAFSSIPVTSYPACQLEAVAVRMTTGAARVQAISKYQKLLLKKMKSSDGDSNFLLLMDTHSDYETGWVAHATRKDGAQFVSPVSDVSFQKPILQLLTSAVSGNWPLHG
jgi:hypothetical protein